MMISWYFRRVLLRQKHSNLLAVTVNKSGSTSDFRIYSFASGAPENCVDLPSSERQSESLIKLRKYYVSAAAAFTDCETDAIDHVS